MLHIYHSHTDQIIRNSLHDIYLKRVDWNYMHKTKQ